MNENGKINKTQKQQNNKKMLPTYILARLGRCFYSWSATVIPWVSIPGVFGCGTHAHTMNISLNPQVPYIKEYA